MGACLGQYGPYMHFTYWPTVSCPQDSLPHHPCIIALIVMLQGHFGCSSSSGRILLVTPAHVADEVWYWPKCILCSGWLFREMWFIEPSYKTKQFSMKCSSYHFVWSLKSRVLPFPSPSHWLSWWWFWYSPARPFSRSCALFLVGSPVWQYTFALTQELHHWCS